MFLCTQGTGFISVYSNGAGGCLPAPFFLVLASGGAGGYRPLCGCLWEHGGGFAAVYRKINKFWILGVSPPGFPPHKRQATLENPCVRVSGNSKMPAF